MTEDEKHSIGKALGRVPSGIFILTAMHDGKSDAMMASWAQQASFSPPGESVASAKGRLIGELIRARKLLALSVLPNDDKTLMNLYARLKPGDEPFAGVNTRAAANGLP